ncbi:unnamed protein product, partial [Ranitomeya imitator]
MTVVPFQDIARILQEKEEKRRKKHYPPRSPEDPSYPDHEGHHRGRRKEYVSEYDSPQRHERSKRNRKERGAPKSERSSYYDDDDRKRGRSAEPRSIPRDNSDLQRHENHISKTPAKKDTPGRPPPPRASKHKDFEYENAKEIDCFENLPRRVRSQSHDDLSTKHSGIREHEDRSYSKAPKRGTGGDHENERHRQRTPSPRDERSYRESGHRSKAHRESPPTKPGSGVKNRDTRDAQIARRLQEEEIRVNTEDYKAAQLAQDEELARWLMEKEQQSYRKPKGREKVSDRKRPDERELTSHEHGRPRSRDDQHRSRSRFLQHQMKITVMIMVMIIQTIILITLQNLVHSHIPPIKDPTIDNEKWIPFATDAHKTKETTLLMHRGTDGSIRHLSAPLVTNCAALYGFKQLVKLILHKGSPKSIGKDCILQFCVFQNHQSQHRFHFKSAEYEMK